MQFQQGASVYTADGQEIGVIDRVVIDPRTKEVTHLVIRQGRLFTEEKVLPVDLLTGADPDKVMVDAKADNLPELVNFEETYYIPLDDDEVRTVYQTNSPPALYGYPPIAGAWWAYPARPQQPQMAVDTEQNIPDHTVALVEGATVRGDDGREIGQVERIFTDPQTNQATHFLITWGLVLKHRKLVPTTWIKSLGETEVLLGVSNSFLEKLPEYQEQADDRT